MNKIYTLALIGLALLTRAQGVQIVSVNPTQICPGDSITVVLKSITGNNTAINLIGQSVNQVWQYSITSDTTITLHTRVDIGKGIATLKSMSHPDEFSVNTWCELVGIKEHQHNDSQPIYYDITGKECKPAPNKILIKYQNGVYSKTLIQAF